MDRLLADPELGSTPKAVAVALVRNWAWYKDHCWPSDRSIAARVGRSVGHVQRCLRALETHGWIARERAPDLPTGRRIRLVWRTTESPPGPTTPPESAARPAPPVSVDAPRPEPEPLPMPAPSRPRPRAEARTPASPPPALAAARPSPEPAPSRPVRKTGLEVAELTRVVAQTGDPILAAELARRLAPPPRPETPPETWATADLLARLPGRHDLTFAAARRLSALTGEFQPASLRAFEAMARAVVGRAVAPEDLADCVRQARGPQARHPGKVLVAAWKRVAPPPPRAG